MQVIFITIFKNIIVIHKVQLHHDSLLLSNIVVKSVPYKGTDDKCYASRVGICNIYTVQSRFEKSR
jgi:hypothetical protein